MKHERRPVAVCPICGNEYRAVPAISRVDNLTPICPTCGIHQALESIGISADEQEKIIRIINDHGGAC